ncbi:MAG: GNAT family N-acetyltransferase [Turicibacter sp.]|nr:GNAT family N-acetyltransferase [Turicibacter sp.]
MKQLGTQKLETKRLILRPFLLADAEAMYHNWANDDEVTKYLMWPTHETVEVSRGVLEEWTAGYRKADYYQWAITLKAEDDAPIGSISVVSQDDKVEMVHIGYCIGRKWWQQGIMPEALAAVMQFFFEEVGVNRIESRFDPRNVGSGKVMEKCGMTYEGTLRAGDWNNQGICDAVMYAILASDYLAN